MIAETPLPAAVRGRSAADAGTSSTHESTPHRDAAPGRIDRLLTKLAAPVDAAGLVVFRIGFGVVVAWWAIDYLRRGLVTAIYIEPQLHLGYYPFLFVKPWPGSWPYVHFAAMAILGACIALGLFYRASALLFAAAFTTVFLWERSNYQNHYYLILLLSGWLVVLPIGWSCSLDALQHPEQRSAAAPTWALWIVRLHIGIPYFYGGLAKLNSDWLAGAAMHDFLAMTKWPPTVAAWMTSRDTALAFAWGGLALDLLVVPALIWRRTRFPAFVAAIAFHLFNHFLFSIHIFPWFMIVATTVFFAPDWPRRLLRMPRLRLPMAAPLHWATLPRRARWGFALAGGYVFLQLVLPLRHHLYGGDAGWHERGHYFAWRMMNRSKRTAMRIFFTDAESGETWYPNLKGVITGEQLTRLSRDPEMILDLARQLSDRYRLETQRTLEVRAVVLTCYNGRKPQLQIDPTVNLAGEPRGWRPRAWVLPQHEPLRATPWNRPMNEWETQVTIPPLPAVTTAHGGPRWPMRAPGN